METEFCEKSLSMERAAVANDFVLWWKAVIFIWTGWIWLLLGWIAWWPSCYIASTKRWYGGHLLVIGELKFIVWLEDKLLGTMWKWWRKKCFLFLKKICPWTVFTSKIKPQFISVLKQEMVFRPKCAAFELAFTLPRLKPVSKTSWHGWNIKSLRIKDRLRTLRSFGGRWMKFGKKFHML